MNKEDERKLMKELEESIEQTNESLFNADENAIFELFKKELMRQEQSKEKGDKLIKWESFSDLKEAAALINLSGKG